MRKTLISLESLEDIPIDETCVAIHNPDEIMANDLMEMHEQATNIDAIQDSIDEATAVSTTLESIAVKLEGSQLTPSSSKILNLAIEHLCSRVNYTNKTFPVMESFGGTMTKSQGTKIALEFIKETAVAIWEAIKAAFKKMWDWITSFFEWLFGTTKKQETMIEKTDNKLKEHVVKVKVVTAEVEEINRKKQNNKDTLIAGSTESVELIEKINKPRRANKQPEIKNIDEVKKIADSKYMSGKQLWVTDKQYVKYLATKLNIFEKDLEQYKEITLLTLRETHNIVNVLNSSYKLLGADVKKQMDYMGLLIDKLQNFLKRNTSAKIGKRTTIFPFGKLSVSIEFIDEEEAMRIRTKFTTINMETDGLKLPVFTTHNANVVINDLNAIISDMPNLDKAKLSEGLKQFNITLDKYGKEVNAEEVLFVKFIKNLYLDFINLIKELSAYVITTNTYILAYLNDSIRIRDADLEEWRKANIAAA